MEAKRCKILKNFIVKSSRNVYFTISEKSTHRYSALYLIDFGRISFNFSLNKFTGRFSFADSKSIFFTISTSKNSIFIWKHYAVNGPTCNILDDLIWSQQEYRWLVWTAWTFWYFAHNVRYVSQLTSLLFCLFKFFLIFTGLNEEIWLGVFASIWQKRINQWGFFAVLIRSDTQLSL